MPRSTFPGFPVYVEQAAESLGLAHLAPATRRIAPLAVMANLCAQASTAEAVAVPAILEKAAEFRDQLRVALDAADRMLSDVGGSSTPIEPEATEPPPSRRRSSHPHATRTA